MSFVQTNKLPAHFYSCTHPLRWRDDFADTSGEERSILSPHEILQRDNRNEAYNALLHGCRLPTRRCVFQVIQCLNFHHSYANKHKDWWGRYLDCLFRVFVVPYTHYEKSVKLHYQWYILCPEDTDMLIRYEAEQKGIYLPKRDRLAEPWVSSDKRLRKVRLLPTEACRHWRHETTSGRLPDGL